MKRALSFLLCLVLVFSIFTVNAIATDNYYTVFDSEIRYLWFTVGFSSQSNDIYEFSANHIKWYTNSKIDMDQYHAYDEEYEYEYDGETYTYTITYYAIPAEIYEAQALKHFNIADINVLRNDTNSDPKYNAETNAYVMSSAGGFGDSITYHTKGYKSIGNGKYEVYGYTVECAYTNPAGAVVGVDYIIRNGSPAEIVKCHRVTLEFNGIDVKFISWENIEKEEIPTNGLTKDPTQSYCKKRTVYVTASGKKFHASSICSNMKSPIAKTIGAAEAAGYGPCSKCVSESFLAADLPHISSSWITDEKATASAAGEKHKECTECGEVLETATIKQLKCSKPKLSKIENTSSGVKITWGKVSGADKYYVYRKVKGGSYSRIATTTKTNYTDKGAKSGKTYYYYVKAVNEVGSSDSSGSKSILHLADTTLSTPKSTKSGITLKWKKVTGAEGYQVWRKTGSGSYKQVAILKGNSKIKYTDKSAKKGKTYTYKIKAYKSKTTSAYSNAKKIKDKY